ncbi:MAG: hydrolase [Bacteroidota bacterium]|nr:hydrolase [Bacteroidota bacterium]
MDKPIRIAVDFDGTIVEHRFPEIGKEMPGAFDVLKALSEEGHQLVLWTFRDGDELQAALDFCLNNGIMFWAVNQSFPDEEFSKYISRKIHADLFIDDRNFGGFPGWEAIGRTLMPHRYPDVKTETRKNKKWKIW